MHDESSSHIPGSHPPATEGIYLFTSESVSEGHPDKLSDPISDAILDLFLEMDPTAKVACETFVCDRLVVAAGEFATDPSGLFAALEAEIPDLVRQVIRDTGYRSSDFPGIDPDACEIRLQLNRQSDDIGRGVEQGGDVLGAGDQGLVFGYATDETPELVPLPLLLAHRLVARQAELKRSGELPWLRPDAKSQVSVRYRDERPEAVETVVLSTQHAEAIPIATVRRLVAECIVDPLMPKSLHGPGFRLLVNPTGRFVIGGPQGDTGLTGRKIIVDTYGGRCPRGGGAFSGKDPAKVDRSAAYMARYIAKNVVAAGLARRCTLQLAYAIGVAEPVSLHLDRHGDQRTLGSGDPAGVRPHPCWYCPGPRPAPPRLPTDCHPRTLWARTSGLHLGANRPGREAPAAGGNRRPGRPAQAVPLHAGAEFRGRTLRGSATVVDQPLLIYQGGSRNEPPVPDNKESATSAGADAGPTVSEARRRVISVSQQGSLAAGAASRLQGTRPGPKRFGVPYWIYPVEGGALVQRHVPSLPMTPDRQLLGALRRSLAVDRLVFGQPRQDDLIEFLLRQVPEERLAELVGRLRIDLAP